MIQPREDRVGLFVRRSIKSIREINLGDIEDLDHVVESSAEVVIDLAVIFVIRATDEIEITQQGPGPLDQRSQVM